MRAMADIRAVLQSQYLAALEMLSKAVVACPDARWSAPGPNPFWQVAYHALFYTHLYLQPSEADFRPWSGHRAQNQFLGEVPWPPFGPPEVSEPFTRDEVIEYLALCEREVVRCVSLVDLDDPSGFDWLPFGKLELQIYNIRHIQHHAAELATDLMNGEGITINWVEARMT